jgi:hypothetical protein
MDRIIGELYETKPVEIWKFVAIGKLKVFV